MSETTMIVYGSRTVPLKHQYWELDWLTLEGWMNYMDMLTGSTISDFDKPQDIARSMGREANIRAGKQHWLEENVWVTRAMPAGNIRLGQENIGQSHARSVFFSARYARCHNTSPQELRGLNLNTGTYEEKLQLKTGMKHFFQRRQIIFFTSHPLGSLSEVSVFSKVISTRVLGMAE